ncbi:MAG: hypothetical protein WBM90_01865 [Acidimicrobiia bacterium]
MKTARTRLLAVVLVVASVIGACSSSTVSEQILEGQEGVADVQIDEEDGSIEVETDEGDKIAIGTGEVPDGFPIEIPSGGELASVLEIAGADSVTIVYPLSEYDSLVSFYEGVVSGGDELNKYESSDPRTVNWNYVVGDVFYSVTVAEGDGEVVVGLAVTQG